MVFTSAHRPTARGAKKVKRAPNGKTVERKVFEALPVGVDLDISQVSSKARLMPAQTKGALQKLLETQAIEVVGGAAIAGRPRYRRPS